MHDRHTPAWRWSRLHLAIGVVLVLLIAFLGSFYTGPCFGCTDTISLGPLLMQSGVLVAIVALAVAMVGLIWMVRIVRGPRDEPPPWRYRDH
jgi:hypothetical protein